MFKKAQKELIAADWNRFIPITRPKVKSVLKLKVLPVFPIAAC